jgi:hypothetical protein
LKVQCNADPFHCQLCLFHFVVIICNWEALRICNGIIVYVHTLKIHSACTCFVQLRKVKRQNVKNTDPDKMSKNTDPDKMSKNTDPDKMSKKLILTKCRKTLTLTKCQKILILTKCRKILTLTKCRKTLILLNINNRYWSWQNVKNIDPDKI